MLDRPDRARREELGEEPHHHLAVLEHVRHARRHAQVVLEHVVLARARRARCRRRRCARRCRRARPCRPSRAGTARCRARARPGSTPALAGSPGRGRCRAGTGSARARAASSPRSSMRPLVRRDDARDDVERDQALGARVLAVDGERDADAMERALGLVALLRDAGRRRCARASRRTPGNGAGSPPSGARHFVVGGGTDIGCTSGSVDRYSKPSGQYGKSLWQPEA